MRYRLVPALFFCLSSPASGGNHDLHGLRAIDAADQADDPSLDPLRPDLRQRLDKLPPDVADRVLAFLRDFPGDSRQQNDALGKALEVEEATLQLRDLQDAHEQGRLSDKEFQRRKEAGFRRIDDAMIKHMSRAMHRAFMRDLAETLSALGYDLTARHARHWQEKDPGAAAYAYGAQAASGGGDHKAALQDAQTSLKFDPGSTTALGIIADSSYKLGRYGDAQSAARRLLELDPGNPQATAIEKLAGSRVGPVQLASPGELPAPQAAPSYDAGAPQAGGNGERTPAEESRRLYEASRQDLESGQYQAAMQNANASLRLDPRNWAARYVRARVHIQNENWGEALRDTQQALKDLPPNDTQSLEQLLVLHSVALNRMGLFDQALASAERAIGLNSYNSKSYWAKAWALAGLGRRKEALEAMATAARLNGKLEALYQRAQALPPDGDLLALFHGGSAPREPARESGRGSESGILVTILLTIVGGFLIALGLLQVVAADGLSRIRRMFGRVTRPGLARRTDLHAGPPVDGQPAFTVSGLIAGMYQVLRQLGVGGMGVVYEAVDRSLERKVAIKKMREEIRSDPRERERFLHEARTVASLHHANIVEIYSIVEDGPDVYLVFEYVDGRTVHELIQDANGTLPFETALGIMRGTCAALDFAHRHNIIHRDLKPSNVMIDREGHVKVMDFGVARQAKDSLSRLSMTNTVVGTPPYMAPEQEQGIVRKESDVYALAVCLYEMVTGQLPFSGVGAGMLIAKLNGTYLPPSRMRAGLPPGFDDALGRALNPDPDKRWRTAGEFFKSLETLATPR